MFNLGLSSYDLALLYLCPAGAALGSFAYCIVDTIQTGNLPKKESDYTIVSDELAKMRGRWLGLRAILSAILGLVLGLYFIGVIQETPSTLFRIVALSIVLGYSAPNIWMSQEKIISEKVKNLVKDEINKTNNNS